MKYAFEAARQGFGGHDHDHGRRHGGDHDHEHFDHLRRHMRDRGDMLRFFMGRGMGRGRRGFGRRFGPGGPNLRDEILTVLADGPRHGYDVMLEIEHRAGFRPSPGSIYPALAMLEDAGFVRSAERDGKRVYEITDEGRTEAAAAAERKSVRADHEDTPEMEQFVAGARSLKALIEAAKQVARLGDPKTIASTTEILDRARKEIYKLLSDV